MCSLLCLIAHPDDEIFCAGLLAQLAALDIPVHLACLTRGEGGTPPASLPERRALADLREHELRCSAQVLGIRTLSFLDYRDRPPHFRRFASPRTRPGHSSI